MKKLDNCYVNITDNDIEYINQSIKAQMVSGKGPYTPLFEEKLAHYFGTNHSLTCSNATSGILMILMLLEVKEGDEVILPSTAPIMSVLPIISLKAKPVFVDNEENSFSLCIKDLNKKITKKTKLLINVPMWGYSNNIDEIVKICNLKGVKVLEDNSHCHGSKLNDSYLGGFGDYSVFSTHERKLITTGEGGFLLIKNEMDYLKLKEIRSFGEAYSIDINDQKYGGYGLFLGLNFKLSSINCAVGITQLDKLEWKIKRRTENASYLKNNILKISSKISEIKTLDNSTSNYYSLVLLVPEKDKIEIENLLLQQNIISDPLRYKYCPLYNLPIISNTNKNCYNSEKLINQIFTLPTHEGLDIIDLDMMVNVIKKYYA